MIAILNNSYVQGFYMDKREIFSLKLKEAIEAARLRTGLAVEELAHLSERPCAEIEEMLSNPGKVPGGQLMVLLGHLHIQEEVMEILQNPEKLQKFMED